MSSETLQNNTTLNHIQETLRRGECQDDIEKIRHCAKFLKETSQFHLARKYLDLARPHMRKSWLLHNPKSENWWQQQYAQNEVWIIQQLALCIYKNEELPARIRFDEALKLLEGIGLRDPENTNAETLSLGGAVNKLKWGQFGQLEDLYESLSFYRAAFRRDAQSDMGYGAINAAFLLDVLADRSRMIARRSGTASTEADRLQNDANQLRQETIQLILDETKTREFDEESTFWHNMTVVEAYFGLKNYEEANKRLAQIDFNSIENWKKHTIFSQLLRIAIMQGAVAPEETENFEEWPAVWQTFALIVGPKNAQRAISSGTGKVGLALSGGGFRASFFHLGVLARLAEMDALRSVEVLSTVSGGSIVGAHYYLEVQHLLQTQTDSEITREDYINIVRRVQNNFFKGVKKNIKLRTFINLKDNWDYVFGKNDYSRSHRLGELYESMLYQNIGNDVPIQTDEESVPLPITMSQLLITPMENDAQEAGEIFISPQKSNWLRRAKVPVLLLNSTSLNSGHNWQFTAKSMGEPPSHIDGETDINTRYRRMYYDQTPTPDLQNYRLGYAVAASACVPGMFEPLTISDLYPDHTVRLVDGGVHDNQGVAGLIKSDCTLVLCSDACGQMGDEENPSDTPSGVLLRASSILQDRVREAEYEDLRNRVDSRALDGLFFVHTRKELANHPLDWINCQDPQPIRPTVDSKTSYGIDRKLQEKIANIRTDLDGFGENEAFALMASGYRICKREFELLQEQHEDSGKSGTWGGYDVDAAELNWPFRPLESIMALPKDSNAQTKELHHQLHVARKVFFKTVDLVPYYKIVLTVIGAIVLAVAVYLLWQNFETVKEFLTVPTGLLIFFIPLVLATYLIPVLSWFSPAKNYVRFFKMGIAIFAYLYANLHVYVTDHYYLARSSLERLLKL